MMHPVPSDIAHYLQPPDVHELQRESAPGGLAAFIFALLLTLAHGLNLYFFIAGAEAPLLGLVFHIVLVVVTAVVARVMIGRGLDSRFLMVLLITSAFFSVLGALGTVLSLLLYPLHRRRSQTFMEWFDSMFPSRALSAGEQTYEDIVTGRDESAKEYSVIPFMDVMEVGSEAQKREALSKMTADYHPSFAPAFKKALHDPSNTIRVQAATAVTRIESRFLERLMKLTGIYRLHGDDPGIVRALAGHYDDYAFTGILDAEHERLNRENALKYYLEYLAFKPDDTEVHVRVGRLMLRSGDAAGAAQHLRGPVARGHRNANLLIWYMEALYANGDFTGLRSVAAQHPDLIATARPSHPALAEALQLWSGGAAAVPHREGAPS